MMIPLILALSAISKPVDSLKSEIESLIRASGAESVGVAYRDLKTGESLFINADVSFHAASTMKVPVMLEVYREAKEGKLRLDEPVKIHNGFASIADGSPFHLDKADDTEIYGRIGTTATVRELIARMITMSSNLATNLIIERVTAIRVMDLMKRMGARGMQVLRGVMDNVAFERGMNNKTTTRDLLILLQSIAEGKAVSRRASGEMVEILLAQKHNQGIPAGLPPGTKVAHKTGSFTGTNHDAGIIYLPGRKPYLLVLLTTGIRDENRANQLIEDISRAVYNARRGK